MTVAKCRQWYPRYPCSPKGSRSRRWEILLSVPSYYDIAPPAPNLKPRVRVFPLTVNPLHDPRQARTACAAGHGCHSRCIARLRQERDHQC